jgi:hypothetical protein
VSNGNSDELSPSFVLPENSPRKRNPPRMDPVKSAAKMVAKNPALIARIKLPNGGEIEIVNKAASPAINSEIELDASVGNDVWDAIAAIKHNAGSHGAH